MNLKKSPPLILYFSILIFNLVLSILLIILDSGTLGSSYLIWSLLVFLIVLNHSRRNQIYFIRNMFLGIPGILAYSVKIIDPDAIFSVHLQVSQSLEIATLMLLLTNISLAGSEIGFYLGDATKVKRCEIPYSDNKFTYMVLFILSIVISLLIASTSSSVIGSGVAYGSGHNATLPISNVPTIANIVIFMMVLNYYKMKNEYGFNYNELRTFKHMLLFAGFFLFVYAEFFRGIRLHALNGIFGCIIIYNIYNNNKSIKLNLKYIIVGFLLFIVVQSLGVLRAVTDFSSFGVIVDQISYSFERILSSDNSAVMFNQGTLNNIAATFSGTIYLIKNNILDFNYGQDYFDYILRIPPKFMYPSRPDDLAWIFNNHGYTSGGGFFELAEAYLNFGAFGAFIVPLIISFIISYSYKQFVINKYSLAYSIIFFSLMSNLVRGLLYQSFALFKGVITGLILLVLFDIFKQLIYRASK